MPQTCKTCKRDDVDEINKLIGSNTPLRYITDNYGIPNGSIQRHKENCIPGLFAAVIAEKREGLLADVDIAKAEIERVRKEFPDDGRIQVQLIAQLFNAIEKEAKLSGAYNEGNTTINIDLGTRVVLPDVPEEPKQIAGNTRLRLAS